MKKCSLNHFTDSLAPWLNDNYIKSVTLCNDDTVLFSYNDGVNDAYEITDCNAGKIQQVCRDLAAKGILVHGLEQ